MGIHDPVTLKRWRRFRQHRRAFLSLCLLLGLYAVSLVSELIANNRPIYVRFRGESSFPAIRDMFFVQMLRSVPFFPAFRDDPQDHFLGDGVMTPPDYKTLRAHPAFGDPGHTGNMMLFAPIPFGPHEILDPASIEHDRTVAVSVEAEAPVGSVNVDSNMVVRRGAAAGWFFGVPDGEVTGRSMTDVVTVTEELKDGVARRFRNEASPSFEVTLSNRVRGGVVDVSAPAFTPRAIPSDSVRISLREKSVLPKWTVRFDTSGTAAGSVPRQWSALDTNHQSTLRALAMKRLQGEVPDQRMVLGGVQCLVRTSQEDVRWPHEPVRGHVLGIDSAGRDVLVRLLYGLRISLSFGLLLVIASMALGIALGMVQGYYGGGVDIVGQRLTEIWHAVPLLYVMMLLGSVLGRSFGLLLVSYIIFNWIGISYYLRAEALRLRRLPFIDAARCLGLPDRRIILRHILPNALTPVVTFFPFSLVGAIGLLAALDYLGFGLPALTPSWGAMLHEAQQYRWAWWLILYPSLALFVVMLLGVFVGEGVRDAYDPRPKSRLE